jgi:hypothetical protein
MKIPATIESKLKKYPLRYWLQEYLILMEFTFDSMYYAGPFFQILLVL